MAVVSVATMESHASEDAVTIPVGRPVSLDGVMSAGEWSDSMRLEFVGGEGVYVKRDSSYLYLGLRGDKGGFASLCIATGDTIRVLHSSTATITATYAKQDSSLWKLVHEFDSVGGGWDPASWRRSATMSQGEVDSLKQLHLERFGWLASTVSLGTPSEMEYQVALSALDREGTYFSVVYYQHNAKERFAHSPRGLSGGSMNETLVRGSTPSELRFAPKAWHLLAW